MREGGDRAGGIAPEEKARLLAEAETPGSSISLVARKYGLSSSLLFRWRHHRDAGSLTGLKAGEPVVPESELQKLKAKVRELQQLLGQKTEEVEILRAGIEIGREEKLLSPAQLSKLEVKATARALGVSCSNLMEPRSPRRPRSRTWPRTKTPSTPSRPSPAAEVPTGTGEQPQSSIASAGARAWLR